MNSAIEEGADQESTETVAERQIHLFPWQNPSTKDIPLTITGSPPTPEVTVFMWRGRQIVVPNLRLAAHSEQMTRISPSKPVPWRRAPRTLAASLRLFGTLWRPLKTSAAGARVAGSRTWLLESVAGPKSAEETAAGDIATTQGAPADMPNHRPFFRLITAF